MGGTCLEPPPVVRLLPLLVTILHPRRSLRRDSRGGFLPWQCSRREALVDVRDNALLGTYQELTASAVAASAKGCYWNQDVEGMCVRAGLKTLRVSRHVLGTLVSLELARAS